MRTCITLLLNPPNFKDQFETSLSPIGIIWTPMDGGAITKFIRNLKHHERPSCCWGGGGLVLPFDQLTNTLITRFVSCVN